MFRPWRTAAGIPPEISPEGSESSYPLVYVSHAQPPRPPPPRRPPPAPKGPAHGSMSEGQKQALTVQALGLLNEQVQARIVHYKGDLETSPELDAVTAQVVAQLKAMQAAALDDGSVREAPDLIEQKQIDALSRLLQQVFVERGSSFITKNLKPIGKRIAKLFFASELHERTKGDKEKTIFHPEQGVYYVLSRYTHRLGAELEGFEYASEEIKAQTALLLGKIERDLQVAFLSRRSPELNRVMSIYTAVLTEFLQEHIPPRLPQMAKVTIRGARSARRDNSVSYKIQSDAFFDFRAAWERLFMQQMVNYCGDELLARLTGDQQSFHDETVKFFTDPHIFSETADEICAGLYDYLCLEGFLDVPVDWRVSSGEP